MSVNLAIFDIKHVQLYICIDGTKLFSVIIISPQLAALCVTVSIVNRDFSGNNMFEQFDMFIMRISNVLYGGVLLQF